MAALFLCHGALIRRGPHRAGSDALRPEQQFFACDRNVAAVPMGRSPTAVMATQPMGRSLTANPAP